MIEEVQSKKPSYYLPLLTMCCFAFWAICMIAQDRLVLLPSGYVAATIFAYPFVCCILDIIAEIYGYKIARKTLWTCLLILFVFALILYLFAHLPSPPLMTTYRENFNAAMQPIVRNISIAWVAIVIGQYINIYLISKLYFLTRGKYFAIRSIGATIIGDTVTFILCIWGFFVNSLTGHQILVIIIYELLIMYGMAILLALPASLLVSFLKKVEPGYNNGLDIDFLSLLK